MYSHTNRPIHPLLTGVPGNTFPPVFNRMFAAIIDYLCLNIVVLVVVGFSARAIPFLNPAETADGVLFFVFFLLVRALVMHTFSTTPGLSLYGLRVVSSEDLGAPALKSLLFRIPFQFTLVLLFSLWAYRHRMTVYDMICNVAYVPEYLLKMHGHQESLSN